MYDRTPKKKRYYNLVASLPAFRPLNDNKDLPLTRIHLERRLRFLSATDTALIDAIVDTFASHRLESSEAYLKRVKKLKTDLKNHTVPLLNEITTYLLRERALISLMRIKTADRPVENFEAWRPMLGEISSSVERNWKKPVFGLQKLFPHLTKVEQAINENNPKDVEHHLVKNNWRYLTDRAFEADTQFTLESVAIYVLRWHLLRRWIYRKPEESLNIINDELDTIVEQTELKI